MGSNDDIRVTLGIAARNEEATIAQTLRDLDVSAARVGKHIVETIVCVNGCTDRTEEKVVAVRNDLRVIQPRIINSREGLIHAQRRILDDADPSTNIVAFIDADIRLAPDVLPKLIEALRHDRHLVVAAARPQIAVPMHNSPGCKAMNIRSYIGGLVETPRRHLVGRCFAFRKRAVLHGELVDVYDVQKTEGFLAEDVLLSFSLCHRWGVRALREIPEAIVHYHPVTTWRDWKNGWKRIWHDLEEIRIRYPHFLHLANHFERKLKVTAFKKLPADDRLHYIRNSHLTRILRGCYLRSKDRHVTWIPATSTKHDPLAADVYATI